MVKECQVILNNSEVTVIQYDDVKIQFPALHKKAETVFVSFDNDNYSIVDNPDSATVAKRAKKKTTSKKNAKCVESTVNEKEA